MLRSSGKHPPQDLRKQDRKYFNAVLQKFNTQAKMPHKQNSKSANEDSPSLLAPTLWDGLESGPMQDMGTWPAR